MVGLIGEGQRCDCHELSHIPRTPGLVFFLFFVPFYILKAILGTTSDIKKTQVNDFPAVSLDASLSQRIVLASSSSNEVAQAFGGGTFLSKEWVVFLVLRANIQAGSTWASFFSASDSTSTDDFFSFRVALSAVNGIQEVNSRVVINANSAGRVDRLVTADDQWHVLALVQSGFEFQIYKDGTVDPIILDHGLESAEVR